MVLLTTAVTVHAAPVGKVSALTGRADVTSPGTRAVILEIGAPVNEGDIVRTKSRSKVEITFGDGSIVRLAASSRIRIDEYAMGKGKDRGILKLFRGKIQSIVKKSRGFFGFNKRNRFEVHTPTAVCGVRGTNYFSSYQAGASHFVFKEGSGYGFSINQPEAVMLISAGQAMSLAGADQPPVIRPATETELAQHSEDTDAGDPEGEGDKGGDGDNETPDDAPPKDGGRDDGKDDGNGETDGDDSGDGTALSSDQETPEKGPDEGDASGRSDQEKGKNDGGPGTDGDREGPVASAEPQNRESDDGAHAGIGPEGEAHGGPGAGEKSPEGGMFGDAGPGGHGPDGGGQQDPGYGENRPEGGMYGDAGPDSYGPDDGSQGDPGYGEKGPEGGMYGDAGPGGYGPEGGTYGDAGPGGYGSEGGGQGAPGYGENRPEGGMYGDAGPALMGPDGGVPMDAGSMNTRPDRDGPVYLASGYGYDPAGGADMGPELYPAGGMPVYGPDPGGYQPDGGRPMDGYMPMDIPMDLYNMPDGGMYPDTFMPDVYNLVDPYYTGPDDYFYEPPSWDSTAYVPELAVNHEISWDANGNPGIRLYGTYDPVMMHPPSMGIEMVEGQLDNYKFFLGTIGGVWFGGSVEGDLLALYVGTGGDAGILRADWTGTYSADDSWAAGWTPLTTMEMASTGVPFVVTDPVPEPTPVYYDDHTDAAFAAGGGTITVKTRQGEVMGAYLGFAGQDWGLWRGGIWGEFAGTPDSNWIVATQNNAFGGRDMHMWMEFIGDQWSAGQIYGKVAGAWVDLAHATTGIMGGKLHGVYDPSEMDNLWDAFAGGASLETNRFLAMVKGSPGDKAMVGQLGIPAFEVGNVSLSGSDSLLNVSMNNVTFFSFATGGAPRIWATDDVSGSFTAIPAANHSVTMSGGGLSADFVVQSWTGNKWAAEVTSNGTGTLTRTDTAGSVDLSFTGGAAGAYTDGGAFSGTGAGVAKPVAGGAN
ncbi:MAG: FecR domain-containing protein [Desulfobacterales bacterium]|nr:FecR domain-containing protein [Desulfobacterales bacterium]